MPITSIKPTFNKGELSPSLWGRTDGEWFYGGASVMRNCFVSYRGPASSRAGTMWVGQSLTPASPSSIPPKLVRFQFSIFQSYLLEFGANALGATYMRVIANGGYVLESPVAATGVTNANPAVATAPAHGFANGDWVFAAGFVGITQINSRTFIVQNATASTFTLTDTFGNAVNSSAYGAYSSGGTFSRVFTSYDSPYALADLPYLKVVQSADVMSLCCVNQQTGTEYPPIDLARLAANSWTFTQTTFAADIDAPATCTATTSVTATVSTQFAYCVTAVDRTTGEESIASPIAYITNSNNISLVQGSHTITWASVIGAAYYNVYQAPPSFDTAVPVGAAFGYLGSAFGTQFVNTNILNDPVKSPPLHLDPFARGQVISATETAGGSGYVQASTTAVMVSATGSGAVLAPVVVSGAVVAIIVQNGGEGYVDTDTILIADGGGGTGAAFTPDIGPQTGTYPSVADYFQQRRVYADSINNPDTLWTSKTGAYTNFDASTPPVDDDAVTLTPWGTQVNGVQWLTPMPGGLLAGTGLDTWQVAGAGGAGSPLTPASESAQPQESNGYSPTVKPLRINYDILYVQQLGYTVRDLQYNFFNNIYAGEDVTVLSNHLFDGFTLVSWAWAQIPWKIVWATRSDGKFLSFTYDKEEKLKGWARHDTNGLVAGNEVATEPPVNAPYFVIKRYIPGPAQWVYYIERMDDRLWFGPEDPWCVDAGLSLAQPTPNATLSAMAAEGPGNITGGYLATTGQGYTDPTAQVVDPQGTGSGAVITLTQSGGVLTGFTVVSQGEGYSPGTYVVISDPTGAGGTLVPFVSQNVAFNADQPVFADTLAGDVIRIGGGQAVVSSVANPSQVLASITVPILQTIPNDPNLLPVPAPPGTWSITTPVSEITNLFHLEGMQVYGIADGSEIPLTTVTNGTVTLPAPASAVTIGLPFIAQLQAMHLEMQSMGTIQGKRKKINGATIRLEKSRGVQVGANQPVASALDFQQEVPWTNLVDIPEVPQDNVPSAALPLFTGDKYVNVDDDWQSWNGWEASPGMVAAQQTKPWPMNVLALVPTWSPGD